MALKHRTNEFVDGAGSRAALADHTADVFTTDRHTDFVVRDLLAVERHGGAEVLSQVGHERLSDIGLLLEWHGGLVAHVLLLSLVGVLLVVVALLGLRASGRTTRLSPVFGLLSTPVLSVRRPLTTLTLATTALSATTATATVILGTRRRWTNAGTNPSFFLYPAEQAGPSVVDDLEFSVISVHTKGVKRRFLGIVNGLTGGFHPFHEGSPFLSVGAQRARRLSACASCAGVRRDQWFGHRIAGEWAPCRFGRRHSPENSSVWSPNERRHALVSAHPS